MSNRTVGQSVLIAEPAAGGHRLVYVRFITLMARRSGHSVYWLLGPGVRGTTEYATHLGGLESDVVRILEWGDGGLASLKRASDAVGAESVIVPHGDLLIRSIALRGWNRAAPLVCLIMRDPHGETGSLQRRLRNRLKVKLAAIAGRRSQVRQMWLKQYGYPTRRTAEVVDPFISNLPIQELLDLGAAYRRQVTVPGGQFWFLVTGAITPNKNLPLILDSLELASKQTRRPIGLLVSGAVSDSCRATLTGAKARLSLAGVALAVDDRVFTNDEINVAVAASDAIVTAYAVHYPNSTLIKACALGKRAVVAGTAHMQEGARQLSNATSVDLEAQAIANAMTDVVESAPLDGLGRMNVPTGEDFATTLLKAGSVEVDEF